MNISRALERAPVLAMAGAGVTVHAATITVFAAASLTDVLGVIARDYQKSTGTKIEFNFAGSSVLARQIEEGAPADIFFSADEEWMDKLEQKGIVDKKTRHDRLSNSLVIVVPKDSKISIASAADLAMGKIERIALADPKSVPAGLYAKEYLSKIHLWDEVSPKVVPMANVRAALGAVESADADAGIVYKTDAAISKKVRIAYAVPRNEGPKITYPMAVLKDARNPEAAREFLEYLESEPAGKVFIRFGFLIDAKGP